MALFLHHANTGTLDVALDFYPYPGGRYRGQGKCSGEEFREDYLIPAIQGAEYKGISKLSLHLDGPTYGYPTTWLEEVFGGLARHDSENGTAYVEKLSLVSEDETLKREIAHYIEHCHAIPGVLFEE